MVTQITLALLGIFISTIWGVSKKLKKQKPFVTYKDFQDKAAEYLMIKAYDNAIEMKLHALELDSLSTLQRGDLLYGIGGIYLEVDDYEMATYYFDQAFNEVSEEKIPYDKKLFEVLDAYVKANREIDAKNLLESLLKRQSYDRRFKKLEKYRFLL